jgi:hypothetical protein
VKSELKSEARTMLDAWHESGADRVDPVRFRFIEAMERRALVHSGEARRILDERLSALIGDYAGCIEIKRTAASSAHASSAPLPGHPTRGALSALTDHIARHASAPQWGDIAPRSAPYPELPMLQYFRETWARMSTEKQLRQSLAQVPGNAGPLNSSSLVHRSLTLMRELSPGYLQQFLSYVDALSSIEQMNGGNVAADKEVSRSGIARKNARGKAR